MAAIVLCMNLPVDRLPAFPSLANRPTSATESPHAETTSPNASLRHFNGSLHGICRAEANLTIPTARWVALVGPAPKLIGLALHEREPEPESPLDTSDLSASIAGSSPPTFGSGSSWPRRPGQLIS